MSAKRKEKEAKSKIYEKKKNRSKKKSQVVTKFVLLVAYQVEGSKEDYSQPKTIGK